MSLTLSEDQAQQLWTSIGTIRDAMGDLMLWTEASHSIGLGSLSERVEKNRLEARSAAIAMGDVLREAAGLAPLDQVNAKMGVSE